MLHSGRNKIDPRGLNAAVPENISKASHVMANLIECSGKQVAEIMWKNLSRFYMGLFTNGLHFCPNLLARQGTTASGEKQLTRGDFAFPGVFNELAAQLTGDENGSYFSLQGNLRLASVSGLYRDIAHFANPNAGGTDGLY